MFKKKHVILGLTAVALLLFITTLQTGLLTKGVRANKASAQTTYPNWSQSAVYVGGDKVIYEGSLYEAKWWTSGDIPSNPTNSDACPWKLIEANVGEGTDPEQPGNPEEPEVPEVEAPSGTVNVLTDEQINALWGGINAEFSPAMAENRLSRYLSKADFEQLFPRRYGSQKWLETNPWWITPGTTVPEYYSYDNLSAAIKHIANLKYKIEIRQGVQYAPKLSVLNKETKTEYIISQHEDYNASWNISKPVETKIVDFGSFLAEGSENDKKREIAGFLANISHETSGGWDTAPDGMLAWGLYFNEETSYINSSSVGYVDGTHTIFPPVAGKSYHGRGPIQLSWNYNYGLFSAILYQDKNILLNNPELVTQDGKLGFMSALLFWMTPQDAKPSCHDIMVNNWVPTALDITNGRTQPCFGMTIVVINGGYEANKDETDYRLKRRIGHYRDITSRNGADITGEKLDTVGMNKY